MLLQTVSPIEVLGTTVLFALFLSLTAHLAARNVLGDVDPRRALYVGPFPAVVAVVGGAFSIPAFVTVPIALAADAAMFRWSYERSPRTVLAMTVIHVVITVLLGVVLGGIVLLLATRPT
ncbi:hypothetical protein GRS48_01905 [Halorubrum sp. JWXQ-INN 858]|uniref:DUF7473 family protein n=1 Tax=Halorubrum sp. JWXQ-INN 858 TaxID=2690782 RepID=UPI00135AF3D4|nr:hypothetical protein [Halorubrum sp. JWXQ-INN 858]MWV63581.1 hypothetical protein [Halorubrum sp. JWXQ-INN 858]